MAAGEEQVEQSADKPLIEQGCSRLLSCRASNEYGSFQNSNLAYLFIIIFEYIRNLNIMMNVISNHLESKVVEIHISAKYRWISTQYGSFESSQKSTEFVGLVFEF